MLAVKLDNEHLRGLNCWKYLTGYGTVDSDLMYSRSCTVMDEICIRCKGKLRPG